MIGRDDVAVVGGGVVPLHAVEVRHVERDARHQLVRDAGRDLPVVPADAPALDDTGVIRGRHDQLSERAPERSHLVDLRDAIAVGRKGGARRVVGAGHEVGVEPGAVRVVDRRVEGVHGARESHGRRRHVPAERRLQRGLAVAEEIVRNAEPRPDVLPARHVLDRVELPWADEPAAGRFLLLDLVVQVIEAHAGVDREPLHRPGILRVQAEVGHQTLLRDIRRGTHSHRERRAVADGDRHVVVGPDVALGGPFHQVEPELHVVRTGHVGDRPLVQTEPTCSSRRRCRYRRGS